MNVKKCKIIGNSMILTGLISLILALFFEEPIIIILSIIGLIFSICGFIVFAIFWKCDYCGKHLPFHGLIGLKKCPYCGNNVLE